jgi:hypothetical protein
MRMDFSVEIGNSLDFLAFFVLENHHTHDDHPRIEGVLGDYQI